MAVEMCGKLKTRKRSVCPRVSVRVIYYDMTDPFWGTKLIDKVAENILSALKNPTEAVLFGE